MKRSLMSILCMLIVLVVATTACNKVQPDEAYHIIPEPQELAKGEGQFVITKSSSYSSNTDKADKALNYLNNKFETAANFTLAKADENAAIQFLLDESIANKEGYQLDVTNENIIIKASGEAGFFYAVQSIRQLLPKEIESVNPVKGVEWVVPAVSIKDEPRFQYRGTHLDVGRHMFPLDAIKKHIDIMAMQKLNTFHWHLTEDQGWRIEIKKYPKLQEISAYRDETIIGHNNASNTFDGKRYGGYYTQEEAREIVRYAAERCITVIPEIEMPGHSTAVLAAYPEFGCGPGPYEVVKRWGVFPDIYCPKEETFEFLEDVLVEIMDIFPSKYIHIGGDEAPKTAWEHSKVAQAVMKREGLKDEHELQSYFIGRMEKFLLEHDRNIIGWDEILEGGLAPQATVMSWRGISGGIEAAKQHHDVIMTPTTHLYLDFYQGPAKDEPLAIGGYLPVERVYSYEPIPEELTEDEAKYVLGAQANLWTEYIPTVEHMQYMYYPRVQALSEVVWSPKEKKNYDDFVDRLKPTIERLEYMGIKVAKHVLDVKVNSTPQADGTVKIEMTADDEVSIYYTTDGSEPDQTSKKYDQAFSVDHDALIKAVGYLHNEPLSKPKELALYISPLLGQAGAFKDEAHTRYKGIGDLTLTDGLIGSTDPSDGHWLGFNDSNLEVVYEVPEGLNYSEVKVGFLHRLYSWIVRPASVKVYASADGVKYKELGVADASVDATSDEVQRLEYSISFDEINAKYLKIIAVHPGVLPKGHTGAGENAWLFADEIYLK